MTNPPPQVSDPPRPADAVGGLWTRQDSPGRWSWGRGGDLVGHLTATEAGGIEPVDALGDADLVTASLMARLGLASYDPSLAAWPPAGITPAAAAPSWQRSTTGRAKGTGRGPTLADRARVNRPQ
jgi:hypothetical protein